MVYQAVSSHVPDQLSFDTWQQEVKLSLDQQSWLALDDAALMAWDGTTLLDDSACDLVAEHGREMASMADEMAELMAVFQKECQVLTELQEQQAEMMHSVTESGELMQSSLASDVPDVCDLDSLRLCQSLRRQEVLVGKLASVHCCSLFPLSLGWGVLTSKLFAYTRYLFYSRC